MKTISLCKDGVRYDIPLDKVVIPSDGEVAEGSIVTLGEHKGKVLEINGDTATVSWEDASMSEVPVGDLEFDSTVEKGGPGSGRKPEGGASEFKSLRAKLNQRINKDPYASRRSLDHMVETQNMLDRARSISPKLGGSSGDNRGRPAGANFKTGNSGGWVPKKAFGKMEKGGPGSGRKTEGGTKFKGNPKTGMLNGMWAHAQDFGHLTPKAKENYKVGRKRGMGHADALDYAAGMEQK